MHAVISQTLPILGFDLSVLFCATQEEVQKQFGERFEYTGHEQDAGTIEEAYYLGHLGIHFTYQDGLVSEIMVRGRRRGHDICAKELRSWAGLGHGVTIDGPNDSIWRLVDVDDCEVYAHSSLLPSWRPRFEALLGRENDEIEKALEPSFSQMGGGGYFANAKSRVDLHLRFSRVDGRLNRLALNLPLGIDVPARKEEIFEWAGIASGSTGIEAGGLVYRIRVVRHGIVLDGSTLHWRSPLPDASTIPVGRKMDNELSLVEAAALAQAELTRRFPMKGPMAEVIDPERLTETDTFYVFHSISACERDYLSWLPQTYDPQVGLDDPLFSSSNGTKPLLLVDKKTGRSDWGSFSDKAKFQVRRLREWISSLIHSREG